MIDHIDFVLKDWTFTFRKASRNLSRVCDCAELCLFDVYPAAPVEAGGGDAGHAAAVTVVGTV